MLLRSGRGIYFFITLKGVECNLQKNSKNAVFCSKMIDFA